MNDEPTQTDLLAGIRVVEFAQNMAVPSCGRVLAAMGADVVKVEPPEGDATRWMAPFAGMIEGRGYCVVNPGKRSIVLDLTDPASHPVRDALLRSADVVLCAFKGTDLERFGLTYERVRELRPDVIYLEHRALGSKGPDRDEGGYDVLVQGLSGLSFITSRSERGRPVSVRPAYSDMSTGLASVAVILGALLHRERTGEGQRVSTSLLSTAHWLAMPTNARFTDRDQEQLDDFRTDLALMRAAGASFDEQRELYEDRVLPNGGAFDFCFRHYITADAMISVGALSPMLMTRFYETAGIPDPRKLGYVYRSDEWNALVEQAEAVLRSDTTEAWIARLRAGGVPCSRYYLPTEAVDDEGAVANGFVEDLDHPTVGRYRTTSTPMQMERNRIETRSPSPLLGEHTAEVLRDLGFEAAEIEQLHERGVIRHGRPG